MSNSEYFQNILVAAHTAAHRAVEHAEDKFACGFAWVTIDGTSPLARHCRKMAKSTGASAHSARRLYGDKGYPRGHQWWCPGNFPGQSVEAHEKGAIAFRDKLAEYGISATVGSRLD